MTKPLSSQPLLGGGGEAYVVFGQPDVFGSSLNFGDLDGGNGFSLDGVDFDDQAGFAVHGAGDVNGDGIDDVVVSAPDASANGKDDAGETYVVFGRQQGFPANLALADLDGSNGFVLNGIALDDQSGFSVGGAGDINGDGTNGLAIGAPKGAATLMTDDETMGAAPAGSSGVVAALPENVSLQPMATNELEEPNDTISQAIDSGIGLLEQASFTANGFVGDNPDVADDLDVNLITFQLLEGDRVTIDIDADEFSSDLDSVLRLLDSDGNQLAVSDDDPAPGEPFTLDSFVDFTAGFADTYFVGVSGFSNFNYDPFLAGSGSSGSRGDYAIKIDTFPIPRITGTDGDDCLIGTPDNDNIFGLGGDDTILARAGDDVVDGGTGNDGVVAGAGNDDADGGSGEDLLVGEEGADSLDGGSGDDDLSGGDGDDLLTGGGDRDRFATAAGEGPDTITDFGGVGRGGDPSHQVINEVDIVQFSGAGLVAENMLLTQVGDDLEITFEGVENTNVILQNSELQNLDNLPAGIGNILFDGQQTIEDDFDVFNADQTWGQVFRRDTVTFLNDLDNDTRGFSSSDDVINGQGGDDILRGLSGDDLLRGGAGDDVLAGGAGDDVLVGGAGASASGVGASAIGLNFTASTFGVNSDFIPPDTMGAVGPDDIVELINGRYAVYDKETGAVVDSSSLNDFWSDAGVAFRGSFAFDPRVLYDPFSERWFAVSVDNSSNDNQVLVAVSDSADPTDGWTGFGVDSDSADLRWADYPTLGLDADGLYVSANMFPIPGRGASGLTNTILIVPKDELLDPAPEAVAAIARVAGSPDPINGSIKGHLLDSPAAASAANTIGFTLLENNPISDVGFAVQPIVNLDNTGLPEPLMARLDGDTFKRSSISGDVDSPSLDTFDRFINVDFFGARFSAEQPGPKQNLEIANGSIFQTNLVQQGAAIWGAHSVDDGGRAAVRWFQIDAQTDEVLQEGLIADSDLEFYYPSIAVNERGDVVIGFSGSSENQFVSTYAVVGTTELGVTTFGEPMLLKEGVSDYEVTSGAGRNRWGDYSATVVDPEDPFTFWTFQEFVSAEDVWSTQITELILSRGGGQDRFLVRLGEGTDTITDFGGVGHDGDPAHQVINEVDIVQFSGAGLVAENMLLTQVGSDLKITFEGVEDTKVVLQDFALENLDNLASGIGNILFDGQEAIEDDFDVVNAEAMPSQVFRSNTVTFLNDLNNDTRGFNSSDDVINGQGGEDILRGLSGDDVLRGGDSADFLGGGAGRDTLRGGFGDDVLEGGSGGDSLFGDAGNDTLIGSSESDQFIFSGDEEFFESLLGIDRVADFERGADDIGLDKTVFSALSSPAGGPLDPEEFEGVASVAEAEDSDAFITYEGPTGNLFYNENGADPGFGEGAQFASLLGVPKLTENDFLVV